MKTKVWEVKMGNIEFPSAATSTKNICATTLRKAIDKAEKAERKFCAQMSENEGEKFTPDRAIAVRFLCELDD